MSEIEIMKKLILEVMQEHHPEPVNKDVLKEEVAKRYNERYKNVN